MINQEITILDGVGLPAGLPDGEAGIKTSYSPTGPGLGLSLAIRVIWPHLQIGLRSEENFKLETLTLTTLLFRSR